MSRGGGRRAEDTWNGPLRRLVFGHFVGAAAEWAVYIGAFVYAFQQGGARATGFASIVLLAVTVVSAPLGGLAVARLQPNSARLFSFVAQAAGLLVAGVGAFNDASLIVVLAGSAVMLASFRMQRPAQAILLPLLCNRPAQLSTASLWIGHSDSFAALAGPLASTGLMLVGGPGAVLFGFGVLLVVAAVLQLVDHSLGASSRQAVVEAPTLREVVMAPIRQLRARGGLLILIGLIMFQYGLVGALDILFVVISLETLELDEATSSLLTTSFGLGALGAVVLSSLAYRLQRLAASLSAGLFISGLVVAVLATLLATSSPSLLPLLIGLPALGAARFTVVVVSRTLLQRSADDDTIGGVFALMELGSGIGILTGSVVAQITLAISGPTLTLSVFAAAYGIMLVASWRSVRTAEATATVPIVEMGVLRKIPAFAPLPSIALETVARRAELVEAAAGTMIIEQGAVGDRFFVVTDGAFDVVMDGDYVRTVRRGGSFGEVALLAQVKRTATVTAVESGSLLAIEQEPFLRAVASHDVARQHMVAAVSDMDFGDRVVEVTELTPNPTEAGS